MVFLEAVPGVLVHQREHVAHPFRGTGDVYVVLVRQGDLQQVFSDLVFVVLVAQPVQCSLQIFVRQVTQSILVQCHYGLGIPVLGFHVTVIYRRPGTAKKLRREAAPFVFHHLCRGGYRVVVVEVQFPLHFGECRYFHFCAFLGRQGTFFGSDYNHAVCRPCSPDAGRCRIFQNGYALHVVGVDAAELALNREAVHHQQGVCIRIQ